MVQEHGDFLNQLAGLNLESDFNDENDGINDGIGTDDDNSNPIFDSPGRPGSPPQLRNRGQNQRLDNQRQDNLRQNNLRQDNLRQNSPRQDNPGSPQSAHPAAHAFTFTAAVQRRNQNTSQPATGSQPQQPNSSLVTPGISPNRSQTGTNDQRQNTRRNRNLDPNTNSDTGANTGFNDSRFRTNNPIVQALQQVATRRLAMTESELQNLSSEQFDRAFMQVQINLHAELIASQAALASIAQSRELQQVLAEGQSMDDQHLAEARRILSQLGTTGNGTNDNRNNNDNRGNVNDREDSVLDNSGDVPSRPFLRRPGRGSTNPR
jgi:hypothetical protein